MVAELFARAGVEADYAALAEEDKLRVLLAALADPRPLRSPYFEYSALAQSGFGVFEKAREVRAQFGARAVRNYIISHTENRQRPRRVLLLQKETGLLEGALGVPAAMRRTA